MNILFNSSQRLTWIIFCLFAVLAVLVLLRGHFANTENYDSNETYGMQEIAVQNLSVPAVQKVQIQRYILQNERAQELPLGLDVSENDDDIQLNRGIAWEASSTVYP